MKWIGKTENQIKSNKMQDRMDNTSTFFVLILKKMRREQSMYTPNMRRFENEVLHVVLFSTLKYNNRRIHTNQFDSELTEKELSYG